MGQTNVPSALTSCAELTLCRGSMSWLVRSCSIFYMWPILTNRSSFVRRSCSIFFTWSPPRRSRAALSRSNMLCTRLSRSTRAGRSTLMFGLCIRIAAAEVVLWTTDTCTGTALSCGGISIELYVLRAFNKLLNNNVVVRVVRPDSVDHLNSAIISWYSSTFINLR